MKYSMNLTYDRSLSYKDRISALKSAGFTHAFLWWDQGDPLRFEQVRYMAAYGLETETAHLQFKGINTENDNRQIVIYARVSTRNQKDDLQNQVTFLRQFCNAKGIIVDQCIEDYGSGLNYNRKKWNELLDEVMEQKIKTSCRILFQYSMCSLVGCMGFVSIKNK